MFSELDLRSRWTFLEFNKYRKDNDDTFYYLKKEEVYPEDIYELIHEKKIEEEKKEEIKEGNQGNKENTENKFGINIEEGNVDDDNKDALLIESHNEQKKQDLDELD